MVDGFRKNLGVVSGVLQGWFGKISQPGTFLFQLENKLYYFDDSTFVVMVPYRHDPLADAEFLNCNLNIVNEGCDLCGMKLCARKATQ